MDTEDILQGPVMPPDPDRTIGRLMWKLLYRHRARVEFMRDERCFDWAIRAWLPGQAMPVTGYVDEESVVRARHPNGPLEFVLGRILREVEELA